MYNKIWRNDRCYKFGCSYPVFVDRHGTKWTFCEHCLRETKLGPWKDYIPDPHHSEYDRW